jgi:gamma-polyglutamate synthase
LMAFLLTPWISRVTISPFLLLLLVVLITIYVFEMARHRAMVKRIPTRIHVNGTRGKSSVTRLIAAGLREGGVRTFAKTTGSAPVMILPDGTEEPIVRTTAPNIREQLGIIERAAKMNTEALVIECMAVRPDLQNITEKRIVHSTHGVITNVRPDHLEVMGPRLEHVAIALSSTTPKNGKLFTSENRFAEFLRDIAERKGTSFHLTTKDREPTVDEMDKFNHVEIPENVALALDICESVGVKRELALEGMYKVTPDVGATTRTHLEEGAKSVEVINAFAANDRESTVFLWQLVGLHKPGVRESGVLINNRGDRMRRAKDIARIIAKDLDADWFIVAGDHASAFINMAARAGAPREKLINMGSATPEQVYARMFELTKEHCPVLSIGNMGGFGAKFMSFIEKRGGGTDAS